MILGNNRKLHEAMLDRLIHTQSGVLDITHSGELSNIFSNDIGILDNALFYSFFEGLILLSFVLVYIANAIQINPYSAILFGVLIVILIIVYSAFRKGIL